MKRKVGLPIALLALTGIDHERVGEA